MAFSENIIKLAWHQAKGKCECTRIMHNHSFGKCNKELVWENRGREAGKGAWEAHHKTSVEAGGSDVFSNCEILCWDCHSKTL